MESMNADRVAEYTGKHYIAKIVILNIDDIYQYMQSELLEKLKSNVYLQHINQ